MLLMIALAIPTEVPAAPNAVSGSTIKIKLQILEFRAISENCYKKRNK